MRKSNLAGSLIASLLLASGLHAQSPSTSPSTTPSTSPSPGAPHIDLPAPSPLCKVVQRVGLTDVGIDYSRPGAKGRKVFGEVVPFDRVWRTGANASTKISFSTNVKLEGQAVPAGKYALFTIPGESEWTVILSKNLEVPGNKYDDKQDLVRVKVKPEALTDAVETFRIECRDIKDESATLAIEWEKTRVPVKLEVEVMSLVMPQIDRVMASGEKLPAGLYFQCATFYLNHDQDIEKASAWVDRGLEQKSDAQWLLLYAKARVLAKKGDKAGATKAANESMELAVKAEGPNGPFAKLNRDLIAGLK